MTWSHFDARWSHRYYRNIKFFSQAHIYPLITLARYEQPSQANPPQIPQLIQFSIKFHIILKTQRIHFANVTTTAPLVPRVPQRVTNHHHRTYNPYVFIKYILMMCLPRVHKLYDSVVAMGVLVAVRMEWGRVVDCMYVALRTLNGVFWTLCLYFVCVSAIKSGRLDPSCDIFANVHTVYKSRTHRTLSTQSMLLRYSLCVFHNQICHLH